MTGLYHIVLQEADERRGFHEDSLAGELQRFAVMRGARRRAPQASTEELELTINRVVALGRAQERASIQSKGKHDNGKAPSTDTD